ncbi:hypothetical protein HUG17_8622 [Dermatophagoides farinae]|uniref:phospholipase A2 n=1 Tax=Dermatophagoides farinae TaxID=6954 RepID=A0A9D4NSL4_DERFA|nr:hypothetical protein HUG17_8622 [Dermatophagoides farinae]
MSSSSSSLLLPRFVRDYQWNEVKILKQFGPLILIEKRQQSQQQLDHSKMTSTKSLPLTQNRYEILYQMNNVNNQEMNILWQTNNVQEILRRFRYIETILATTFTRNMMQKSRCIRFVSTIITTMIDHPNWHDIHIAAFHGLIDYFKKRNFHTNEITVRNEPDNFTVLHIAIMKQNDSIVERIVQCAKPPDSIVGLVDFEGNSPLHLAAMCSNLKIFKTITTMLSMDNKHRCLLQLKNRAGLNPIEIIVRNSRKENLLHLMKQTGLTARMLTIIIGDHEFLQQIDNEKIVPFTDGDLVDMDFSHMNNGGCPLHWIIRKETMKKMLQYFDCNTPNFRNETPLITAIKSNNFDCSLCLLLHGSDPNHGDLNGDTGLHHAVRLSNKLMIKSLLIFDADIDVRNNIIGEQLNPYQVATKRQDQEVVKLFDSFMEARRTAMENPPPPPPMVLNPNQQQQQCCYYLNVSKTETKTKMKKSRLICFDGGGIKGLFTIQMMIELEKCLVQKQRNLKKQESLLLSDYFDWIAGTSTGSIIAYLFSQQKSLNQLRLLYFNFKDEIFHGNRPYSTDKLEFLLKTQLDGNKSMEDVWKQSAKHLLIAACRIDCYPPRLQLFCSHHQNQTNKMFVWQALRASSAAPTYFHHYPPYIDGATTTTTSTKRQQSTEFRKLDLVLSFGTGMIRHQERKNFSAAFDKFNYFLDFRSFVNDLSYRHHHQSWTYGNELAAQMKTQVTNCNDHIVSRSLLWCSCLNITYCRLNSLLTKKIPLDESRNDELVQALWDGPFVFPLQ